MSCPTDSSNAAAIEDLYPAGSVPEIRTPKVSALCSYGARPHALTGFFKQLLLQHFVDPENLEEAVLRTRFREAGAWRPTEQTGLIIESNTRWDPTLTEKRPGIIIKRNDWQWRRLAIGDLNSEDYRSGFITYTGFWSGSHTLFALASKGLEAEVLGSELSRTLVHYSGLVVEQMDLHRFVVAQVGAVQQVEEATRSYAVPVTVAYVAEETWQVQPHAPRLKRIVFRASELIG